MESSKVDVPFLTAPLTLLSLRGADAVPVEFSVTIDELHPDENNDVAISGSLGS